MSHRVLEAASELGLPQRVRSRLLAEVAADADALYAHYIASGDDALTALRKVESRLAVTDAAAVELRLLHEPLWSRLVGRFAPAAGPLVERTLLGLTVLTLLLMAGSAMVRIGLLQGSISAWLVMLLGVAIVVVILVKLFQVRVKHEDAPARVRAGLDVLWLLAIAVVTASITGTLMRTWSTLGAAIRSGDMTLLDVLAWLRWSADLLSVGLAAGFAALVVWFVLASRARREEGRERELFERRSPWSVF